MFYVNDVDGVQFSGPLETLDRWTRVLRKPSVPAKKAEDEQEPFIPGSNGRAVATYQKYIAEDKGMIEPLVHAHQIMSAPVLTIGLETTLGDAWNILEKASIRQVVVINEQRKVLGMLSDRDILNQYSILNNADRTIENLQASEVLKKEVISSHSISDIRRIAKVLATYHINAMPVVEDESLIGIVTRGDILRGFAENRKLNLYA